MLVLFSPLQGALAVPCNVALRSLTIKGYNLAAVGPLLDTALSLRFLRLTLIKSLTMTPSLLSAAPRLTHLELVAPSDSNRLALRNLLASSTSLRVLRILHVYGITMPNAVQLIEACPSALLELDMTFHPQSQASCQPLVNALQPRSMAHLRRWRISWDCRTGPPSDLGKWRAACNKRGIEVRGNERYFTGELCVLSLVPVLS